MAAKGPTVQKLAKGKASKCWDEWKYPAVGFCSGLLFLGASVLLYNLLVASYSTFGSRNPICETNGCVDFGRLLRRSVNSSLNPCHDFYSFVCDGWDNTQELSVMQEHRLKHIVRLAKMARNTKIPKSNQTLLQKASALFQSCEAVARGLVDETRNLQMLMLKQNLSWPSVGSGNVLKALSDAREYLGASTLLIFSKTISNLTTVNIHPSPLLSTWAALRKKLLTRQGYYEFISKAAAMFTGNSIGTEELSHFEAVDDNVMGSFTNLLTERKSISLTEQAFKESSPFPYSDWRDLFYQTLNVPENEAVQIVIHDAYYFSVFQNVSRAIGGQDMVLFISWSVLFYRGPVFSERLTRLFADRPLNRTMSACARCLSLVEQLLGVAVLAPYTHQNIEWDAREDISRLTKNIDYELGIYISNFSGMSSRFREFYKLKRRSTLFPGADDYGNVNISYFHRLAADYLQDMEANSFPSNYKKSLLFKKRIETGAGCYTVKLGRTNYYRFYDRYCDVIVVSPLAVSQPIYNAETTAGLRYGTVGALLSVALFEEFYNSRANLDPVPMQNLEYARSCVARTSFRPERPENAEEAFLLYGAHKALWKAFRTEANLRDRRIAEFAEFSEEQLFFMSFCYLQCSGARRHRETVCNVPLKNSLYFSSAFSCPVGSAMNMGDRCFLF